MWPSRRQTIHAIALLLILGGAAPLQAQAQSSQPQQPSSAEAPPETPKRIFALIPNFTTTDDRASNREPLPVRHKFVLAMDQALDISAHLGNMFQTSMQQLASGQPHYETASFAKRFVASEADQISSCFFIYGVFPVALHADPRYFRREEGSGVARTWYAFSRTFVSRNDAGHPIFNVPQLAGQLAQAGLSNLYYPEADRSVSGTLTNWGIQLAYNSGFNMLKEFYPDLLEKLHTHEFRPATRLLAGTVKAVSAASFIVTSNGSDSTFAIARTTRVVFPGAGTATKQAGGAMAFRDLVHEGDSVRISYTDTGQTLMATEVRVTSGRVR